VGRVVGDRVELVLQALCLGLLSGYSSASQHSWLHTMRGVPGIRIMANMTRQLRSSPPISKRLNAKPHHHLDWIVSACENEYKSATENENGSKDEKGYPISVLSCRS
jgi:hypothetical protein